MSGKKPKALPSLWGVALGALLGALVTTALFTEQGRMLFPGLASLHTPSAAAQPAAAVRVKAPNPCPAAPPPTLPNMRDQLPWEPYLTDEEVQRAEGYYGTAARLRRVAAKLLAGEPIQVFTLGGSVTRGLGASAPERNYANRFFQLINASFPHAGHVFANKGIGGTSSGVFTACAEQMVPPSADLVVVEFTYNEPEDDPFDSPARRGFEELLRKLLKLRGAPAVVMLHHYAWWFTYGDGLDAGLYYRAGEAQLQVFANYYDMPAVSMRNVLWPLMNAGVEGFKLPPARQGEQRGRGARVAAGHPHPRGAGGGGGGLLLPRQDAPV
ncbi:hypothetical protein CHLNCDRAFT_56786 [Chlorella variabilis]|uniref:SGNH hydrolase-type esterase domain-containing protein n=1 Tax=Chlorella variabilis TaxID=554065 RepID=E1Z5C4_CHLVA|nr:hypothetical protein CHLNCDRAFT_56786 [Chlorella variabilis]EFN59203.1 hypothetical protein CHLNCDRAFT_56786 [Chlorella variabilis]|eukprot:XP_005851305.1 hypothetical protein CHLNCDRAFT_56786 [Chlorella variabilis]